MSELYKTLRADIIRAVKARENEKALALRTIDGSIQRVAIDENKEITDESVIATVRKAVKDLENAKEQFAQGGRQDLVMKNEAEVAWLSRYLPAQMDAAALERLVEQAISDTGATTRRDMGKVMGVLKKNRDAATIDFGEASKLIQAKLS
ncbi:MAG: GatB/YqeY domain-containing protein [Opitutales bacterium]